MRLIEDEDWKPCDEDELAALEDRRPEDGALVAYLYDPERKTGGRVVPEHGAYAVMVNGKRLHFGDPEGAIAAAWRMIDGLPPLSPPVPVRRKGGAA